MKILHISKYYSPFLGGVENICQYLVERSKTHKTSVVCFSSDKSDHVDFVEGHKVYRAGVFATIARQALSFSYYSILKKAISEEEPDVIQYHWANPFPAIFLYFLIPTKTKLILHWHMDIVRQWYLYWAVKPLEKWLIYRADKIVVTSPQYRDESKPLQAVKDKVVIVPNCINDAQFQLKDGDTQRINEIRSSYGNRPIVFFMGRHTKYKGLPHLIEADQFIKSDCVILIGGTGPLTRKLKDIVRQRNSSRIHFLGRLSDDELRCHLYASHIFAFPSISRNEAFGVALAEAMYCGVPAVTFTIKGSGVNWVNLNGITGLEVCQGQAQDLKFAEAIELLLNDNNKHSQFAKAAHNRVLNNFMIQHMVDKMKKVYDEINKK